MITDTSVYKTILLYFLVLSCDYIYFRLQDHIVILSCIVMLGKNLKNMVSAKEWFVYLAKGN